MTIQSKADWLWSMIPKSGNRFSEKIMLKLKKHDPESGNRFSVKIMLKGIS
jgi:hypothetical protein